MRLRVTALCAALLPLAFGMRDAEAAPARYLEDRATVAQVLALIDTRLALMPEVAAAKWAKAVPVSDPAREAVVLEATAAAAIATGLAAEPVRELFRLQARLSRSLQAALHERWREQPPLRETPLRSLQDDLRPEIDALDHRLLRALYLAAPALARADFADDVAALAREQLSSPRFAEADRRELVAALLAVRLTGSASRARPRAAKVLRIGTPGDYAPFSVEVGGELSGVDIELAQGLADGLGLEPVFIRTSWRQLLEDLRSDRFDIAVGGISVTPARLVAAAFSVATASGGKTALGRCHDQRRFRSLAAIDQPRVRVVVNPGGSNEQFVHEVLHRAQVRVHADNRTIFEELLQGRADVMLTDDTEVALQTHRHAELCRLLPDVYRRTDKAFLLPPAAGFEADIDAWLAPVISAGTAARLLTEAELH